MEEISLIERLKQMRESEDPYERGIARGVEITMIALGHWEPEDNKESPGALPSSRGEQKKYHTVIIGRGQEESQC